VAWATEIEGMRLTRSARSFPLALVTGPAGIVAALVVGLVVGALVTNVHEDFSDPVPTIGGRNSRCWNTKRPEKVFAKKMNKARRRSGRRKMNLDPELSRVARYHTREMVRRNTLYHTSSAQLRRRVVGWATLGENVGVGNTVKSLHRAFMNSTAHRHNILYSTFKHSGVGVRKRNGRMWVTVIFEANKNPGTRLRMPRC
jgi:uncharacterized protein YkwD